MNCKMTLFVYTGTTTTTTTTTTATTTTTMKTQPLVWGVAVQQHTNIYWQGCVSVCIPLCAHLLNSSFQVSFSDMLLVVCLFACALVVAVLSSQGRFLCIIVLLRVRHFFFTATPQWTQQNPTTYFIIVHTRRTQGSVPAPSNGMCLCAVQASVLLPSNCSAIYLARPAGQAY